jgi:hypothetical protein
VRFLDDVELGQVALAGRSHVTRKQGGKPRARYSLLRSTFIPFLSSPPLYSLFNLDRCPKMRPTAAVRGEAPTGTFGRKNRGSLALTLGFLQVKLGYVRGRATGKGYFLTRVPRFLEPLVGCQGRCYSAKWNHPILFVTPSNLWSFPGLRTGFS